MVCLPGESGLRKIQYPSAAALVLPGFTPQMLSSGRITSKALVWIRYFFKSDNCNPSIVKFISVTLSASFLTLASRSDSDLNDYDSLSVCTELIIGKRIALFEGMRQVRLISLPNVPAKNHMFGSI